MTERISGKSGELNAGTHNHFYGLPTTDRRGCVFFIKR